MCEQILIKVVGLWFTLSVGSLVAATVNPSVQPAENTKLAPSSSSTYGAVYREPRDYNAHESATTGSGYTYRPPYDKPQSGRCISCLYAAMTGNQDRDRYFDPSHYYRPAYPSQSSHGGMSGYGGSQAYGPPQRESDDRSWYYPPADDRNRYSQYENRRPYYPQSNRYDVGRPGGGAGGGYERNDYRQNYQDYRGNGYDNRDPMYYNAMRGGNRGYGNRENSYESYYDDRMSNRGYGNSVSGGGGGGGYAPPSNYYPRPSGGSGGYNSGGYDQDRYYSQGRPYERPERPERPEYYDRPGGYRPGASNSYGGYDDVSFRPWDQSYRGVSGFDSLGHGHYFANYPGSHNSPAHPALPQNGPNQQAPPRPFQHQNGQHETSGHSQHHQQPHNSYDSDSLSHSSGSSGSNSGKGSYDNNWHYINSNDRNPVSHGSHAGGQGHGQSGQGQSYGSHSQDKETTQSSSYGERPGQRPLSTSYLHERDTPTVISGDNAADSNQEKPSKAMTTTNDLDRSTNADTTDKTTTTDTLKNPIDESNTVSSSTGASDQ